MKIDLGATGNWVPWLWGIEKNTGEKHCCTCSHSGEGSSVGRGGLCLRLQHDGWAGRH